MPEDDPMDNVFTLAARRHEAAPPAANTNPMDFGEADVARRFAAAYEGKLAYDHTMRLWYVWAGSVWVMEKAGEAIEAAKRFCETERQRCLNQNTADAMAKARFAKAVEDLARSDTRMAVHQGMWDENPWLLGTADGVVDLRTGDVRPGRPSDWMIRQTSVAPAPPGAPCPHWMQFLDQATAGDEELASFLQRWAGYCLTGDVSEEVLSFLYGDGGNGKGVFVGTITAILGSYCVAQPMEAFTAGTRLPAEYYRAQMAGARLVTSSETEAGRTWAEAQIKELTGNETPVSARHPHGRPFTYRPQFKLMFVGNHAPSLKSRSPAMERRLRIVPFENKPASPDLGLKDRLREEYPAILRWMIDGCLSWAEARLGTATAISTASREYFADQDAFGSWLEERCVVDPILQEKPGCLLSDFNEWARGNGFPVMTSNGFAEAVDRHPNLKRTRTNTARLIQGAGLKAVDQSRGDDR
jgi:putative DNA primase/helicase